MPSELSDLLERGAERPSAEPDFTALARRGRRRRHTQQATTAMAVIAVIALTAGVVMPRLRQPDVVFDSGPRGGVGTWEAVPPAPIGARVHSMVAASDDRVVVFGGDVMNEDGSKSSTADGAMYDANLRTWTPLEVPPYVGMTVDGEANPPEHLSLLDDGRLLFVQGDPLVAGIYDFERRRWETSSKPGLTFDIGPEVVVWAGDRLVVWGPAAGQQRAEGATWRPGENWQVMSPAPLEARSGAAWTWTGDRVLIWGGRSAGWMAGERERVLADGAGYDPRTDTWGTLAPSPLAARENPQALWTGDTWIVMGGAAASADRGESAIDGRDFVDGARYDPVSDGWVPVRLPPKGVREVVFLAGDRFDAYGDNTWAVYDVPSDTWERRPVAPGIGSATMTVGDRAMLPNTSPWTDMVTTFRPRRIGGLVYDERVSRWVTLEEAETQQRWGAAVSPMGDRLFIWGGASSTRDISDGYQDNPWKTHDDGAVLTLD